MDFHDLNGILIQILIRIIWPLEKQIELRSVCLYSRKDIKDQSDAIRGELTTKRQTLGKLPNQVVKKRELISYDNTVYSI